MNIYLKEDIRRVAQVLKEKLSRSFQVYYRPAKEDPESANIYLLPAEKPWETLAVISSVIRWRKAKPDWILPENAQSCIQFPQSPEAWELKQELERLLGNYLTEIHRS